MKQFLLLFLIFLTTIKIQAQVVFCPPGAEWHYNFYTIFINATENQTIKYVGDTIWGAETLKILSPANFYISQNCRGVSRTLIKQKGDTIFMNNNLTQNTWQILYNFAAQPGQSWQTTHLNSFNALVTVTVTVDSIGLVYFNGFGLKRLYVKYASSQSCFQASLGVAQITERFGCYPYLYNYCGGKCSSDGDILTDFLCYSDNSFGSYQFTDKSCNFENFVGLMERENNVGLWLYPNPVTDLFTVESARLENIEASLTDLSGREIIHSKFITSLQLDLSDLKSGVYFVNLSSAGKLIRTEKLIKE
jgi:hypothetical protein